MRLISEKELKKYGKTYSLSKQAIALVNQQKANWELASANYRSLKKVQTRSFDFGHFRIDCQFNPGRIRSSAANTSREAIQSRPCFLCPGNLPPEQLGLPFQHDFTILTNPYPIFPYHLTIPANDHLPQQLTGKTEALLLLSHALSDFTVFYNGPRCGASAPDHFHFQAGLKEMLPVEDELENLIVNHSSLLAENGKIKVFAVENYLRRIICFRSDDKDQLVKHIEMATRFLPFSENEEPMMNLLAWVQSSYWNVVLFPRGLQRPWQYFADEFDRLLVSPAAVEMGGLIILPREEDFYKLTEKDLISVFDQVTLHAEDFNRLKQKIKESVQ